MDRNEIPRFLPESYRIAASRPNGPLAAMLAIMEGMHAPAEIVIDNLAAYVSPFAAPDPFVLLQASWLGIDRYFDWSGDRPGAGTPRFRTGIAPLRLLVAEAAELGRERGTQGALIRFLETATGIRGFTVVEGAPDGTPIPFHFTVHAPAATAPLEDFILRIIEGERPAHATFDLVFDAQPKKE